MPNIKNLQKAANRILKAIKERERIILYGDADLDGVSSVIIVKESIQNLGGKIIDIYFPDREKEGPGITSSAIEKLQHFSPALLISLDCGVTDFKEVKRAKEIGFDVVIIDHHKVLGKLPPADIVVDPKQEGDEYPFKEFAAVGLAFKLAELLLKDKMSESLRDSFLELAALATMADRMPKEEENKFLIEEGLRNIENSWRPGIRALLSVDFLDDYNLYTKVYKMISILNVRDVEEGCPAAFKVLTTSSPEETEKIVARLKRKHQERKKKAQKIIEEVMRRDSQKGEPLIFEGEDYWDYPLISSVASIVCRDLAKPVFLFKKINGKSQGTVRVPSDIDSVDWMGKCKEHLITYGGHPPASGFRIKNENLEKFKKCLIENL